MSLAGKILCRWYNLVGQAKAMGQGKLQGTRTRPAHAHCCRLLAEQLEDRLAPAGLLTLPTTGFSGSQNCPVIDYPIEMSQLDDGSGDTGLVAASLVVTFPTGVFNFPTGSLAAYADVTFGSLTLLVNNAHRWTLSENSPSDGVLIISLSEMDAEVKSTGGGSLVFIDFPVLLNPSMPTPEPIQVISTWGTASTDVIGRNRTSGSTGAHPLSLPATGSITINPAGPMAITTPGLPFWTVNQPGYSQTINTSGGTGPLTFSTTGTLPPGLMLNGAGMLSGTPTALGDYMFAITVTDCGANSVCHNYWVRINATPFIGTPILPNGAVGTPYSQSIVPVDGTNPITFSVSAGTLPPGLTLSSILSEGMLTGTPTTLGSYSFTVTATDAAGASDSLDYTIVIPKPGPLAGYFVNIAGPSTIQAGTPMLVTVQAADASGNWITNYTGPPTLTISVRPTRGAGGVPASVSVNSSGLGFFVATMQPIGIYTISVSSGSVIGRAAPLTVTPGTAVKLAIASKPADTPTGDVLPPVIVQVQDLYGNVVTSDNTDSVTLGVASGPGGFTGGSSTTATVVNGVAIFNNLVLVVPGSYTLSAVVPGEYTGPNSASFKVLPLQVTSVLPTLAGFTIWFNAPFLVNATTPVLYGHASGPTEPVPSVTVTGPKGPVEGSLVPYPTANTLTFVETNTASLVNNHKPILPFGTYTVDIHSSPADNGIQALNSGGGFLDGRRTGVAGSGDYTFVFTWDPVSIPLDALWLPPTADGPGQRLEAPGRNQAGGGYPLYLDDNAGGVTDVQATLSYNPALLTVTPTSTATFTVTVPSAGTAMLHYSGPALDTGLQTLVGFLTASVPAGTAASPVPYKAEDLLHLSNASLNQGTIAIETSDALHLVAYVGDADGNGSYSSNDALLITRVNLQADTGFAAYPLVDPVIVADTDGAGFIPADAALQVNEAGVGVPTANLAIPPIPSGVHFAATTNKANHTNPSAIHVMPGPGEWPSQVVVVETPADTISLPVSTAAAPAPSTTDSGIRPSAATPDAPRNNTPSSSLHTSPQRKRGSGPSFMLPACLLDASFVQTGAETYPFSSD